MNVKTAIILVAGPGTRVRPATWSIDKCMLPIYGPKPMSVIDYVVQDCLLAGIMRVIFVTSERSERQLRDYFVDIDKNIATQLKDKKLGKMAILEEELEHRQLRNIEFEFVTQSPGKYGTAYCTLLAKERLGGEEQFVVMSGDDFVYNQDGTSELMLAMKLWEKSEATHVIMGSPVERAKSTQYGILQINKDNNLIAIDEGPPIERVPLNPVANISSYLLNAEIWPYIEEEVARERDGEYYIIDAINQAADLGQIFKVHRIRGVYMDGGTSAGLLYASNYISNNPPLL